MSIIGNKQIHEAFHMRTNPQLHVIDEKNFTYRVILDVLNKYVKKDMSVLDIGCGSGTLSFYLANKTKSVHGIDISKKAIDVCNQTKDILKSKNTKFSMVDFPHQAPKGNYDLIICIEVIEHLVDDELALKRIFDLLMPNGVIVLSTPSLNAPLYKLGYSKHFDKKVGHLRRYTEGQLIKKFNKLGFKILATKKTEGVVRNFLYLNPIAGKTIRLIKYSISDIVTIIDQLSLTIFGESDIFIVAKKLDI